jgi:hypothetical protein
VTVIDVEDVAGDEFGFVRPHEDDTVDLFSVEPWQQGRGGSPTVAAPLSGVTVSKETVRRVDLKRRQSGIEAEPRHAIGTEDRVRLTHINVDVRVVLRRRHSYALKFLHSDADFGDATVVPEFQIATTEYRPGPS